MIDKLNRREYLTRMAAGTVGFAAAGAIDLNGRIPTLGKPNETYSFNQRKATLARSDWNWTTDEPKENPGIRLIFVGMMVFGHKGKEAQVVFHRGDNHHNLRIEIHEVGPLCRQVFRLGGGAKPLDIDEMNLRIEGAPNNAMFFRKDGADFNRKSGHLRDFRWLLDLEGPLMYDQKLERKDDVFSTKLRVRQGTFFTYQRTNSNFVLTRGTEKKEINHVAKVMAADIPLATGRASLTIDGAEVPYPLTAPAKYEIYFFNECECVDDQCGNCKTSDFGMIFDAVTLATSSDAYNLVVVPPLGEEMQTEGLCQKIPEKIITARNTDEAPCMGGGFGGGGGFP